jgi:N-dimethylarginine dimethylaminohydrolase
MSYRCGQSETGVIESILLKSPRSAWISQENVNGQWEKLYYPSRPDYRKALEEYARFVALIETQVPHIYYLPEHGGTGLDSIYTHDPVVITREGAVLCRMGKELRRGEPKAAGAYLAALGVPILGEITAPGTLEGGDLVWLDEKTAAVGLGYRTNAAGVRQFRELAGQCMEAIVEVPLPHWNGDCECLHLMSLISPVDRDLAVVYSRLMPVPFRHFLLRRGIKLVEVPDEEFNSFGCNVLAVAPRRCIMVAGNPRTREALEKEGAVVFEYPGEEIAFKGGGGPTCLTRPLLRSEM